MAKDNTKDNKWYPGKYVAENLASFPVLYATALTVSAVSEQTVNAATQLGALRENAKTNVDKEVIDNAEKEVAQVALVLMGEPKDQTVSVEKKKQDHQAAQQAAFQAKNGFVLSGEPKDQTISVEKKKANHLETKFVLVGETRDHVDQLEANAKIFIAKAKAKGAEGRILEKIGIIISTFVASVRAVINQSLQIMKAFFAPTAEQKLQNKLNAGSTKEGSSNLQKSLKPAGEHFSFKNTMKVGSDEKGSCLMHKLICQQGPIKFYLFFTGTT